MADQETANAGLEKVTDYVDEQELNADDTADALKNLAANPGARYAVYDCCRLVSSDYCVRRCASRIAAWMAGADRVMMLQPVSMFCWSPQTSLTSTAVVTFPVDSVLAGGQVVEKRSTKSCLSSRTTGCPHAVRLMCISAVLLAHSLEPSTESTQLKISAADVEQIQHELECSADEAKAGLIKASGDVVQALRHLLR